MPISSTITSAAPTVSTFEFDAIRCRRAPLKMHVITRTEKHEVDERGDLNFRAEQSAPTLLRLPYWHRTRYDATTTFCYWNPAHGRIMGIWVDGCGAVLGR